MKGVLLLIYERSSITSDALDKLENTLKDLGISLGKIPFSSTRNSPIFRMEVFPESKKD